MNIIENLYNKLITFKDVFSIMLSIETINIDWNEFEKINNYLVDNKIKLHIFNNIVTGWMLITFKEYEKYSKWINKHGEEVDNYNDVVKSMIGIGLKQNNK